MALSKSRIRKLNRSFNKGSGRNVRQFSQRRKPKKTEKVKVLEISWLHQIIKIIRKKPSYSPEIELTLENGAFLIDEMTSAYIIAE